MRRLILFDLGGVLVYYDHALVVTAVNQLRQRPQAEMVADTTVVHDFVTGKLDGRAFYDCLCRNEGSDTGYATFTEAFCVQPGRYGPNQRYLYRRSG